jgi:hypothetical protein
MTPLWPIAVEIALVSTSAEHPEQWHVGKALELIGQAITLPHLQPWAMAAAARAGAHLHILGADGQAMELPPDPGPAGADWIFRPGDMLLGAAHNLIHWAMHDHDPNDLQGAADCLATWWEQQR